MNALLGLSNPAQVGANFESGFQRGQEIKRKAETRNALLGFTANPEDPSAYNQLVLASPELAHKMRGRYRDEQAYQQDQQFTSAAGDYIRSGNSGPSQKGLIPQQGQSAQGSPDQVTAEMLEGLDGAQLQQVAESYSNLEQLANIADTPQKWDQTVSQLAAEHPDFKQYVGQFAQRETLLASIGEAKAILQQKMGGVQSPAPQANPIDQQPVSDATANNGQTNSRQAAIDRMMQTDPVRARKILADDARQQIQIMKAVDDGYSLAIEQLSRARDEESYQSALQDIDATFAPLGVDIRKTAPPNYPGPEGVSQMLQSSMDAKSQIAAQDRQLRIENDLADDEADNARADRNTSNLIDTRNRRVGLSEQREGRISQKKPRGRKRKGRGKSRGAAPTAVNANGERLVLKAGKWVTAN